MPDSIVRNPENLTHMNGENNLSPSTMACADRKADSTKLMSLLALAGGAAAMPQTVNADIIFNAPPSPVQVGYGYSSSYEFQNLPGTARFGFQTRTRTNVYTTYWGVTTTRFYRLVTAGSMGGGTIARLPANSNYFIVPQNYGAAWNSGSFYSTYYATAGVASTLNHYPASGYSHMYMSWLFADSNQGGTILYGWAEISLSIGDLHSGPGPVVTIYGYAYDNAGNPITMGAMPVPEPSAMSILAVGALALGARGVRSWRRNRATTCQS